MLVQRFLIALFLIIQFCTINLSCSQKDEDLDETSQDSQTKNEPKVLDFEVVNQFPHDESIFTQGIVIDDNLIYESSGEYGQSKVIIRGVESKDIIKEHLFEDQFFAEGLTFIKEKIYVLTWKSKKGFILDKATLEVLDTFSYPFEGWGLAYDENKKQLIISDGSDKLYFLDSESFVQKKTVIVKHPSKRNVTYLNELEYVKGKVFSNVWYENKIYMISPDTGLIEGVCDLNSLLNEFIKKPLGEEEVLNGIAYDQKTDHFFVTGKNWPKIFEIKITNL